MGDEWLQHLETEHRPLIDSLARYLPGELCQGQVWVFGVNAYGLRLRVETPDRDHDFRLPFSRPALNRQDLMVAVDELLNEPLTASCVVADLH